MDTKLSRECTGVDAGKLINVHISTELLTSDVLTESKLSRIICG